MGTFLAGLAERVITPPVGVELAGYSSRISEGVHDELKAIALVLEDRQQKCAACVMDTVFPDAVVTAAVRQRVAHRCGVQPDRLLIAATHTHSGPALGGDNLLNQQWMAGLEDELVRVILEADRRRRDARIGAAAGSVEGIGGNRRDSACGAVDPTVGVVRIDDARTAEPMGLVVHHACHATTLGMENRLISADYPGQVRRAVTERLPGDPVALFLNGACGDINPGGYSAEASALGKLIPNRTFERAQEMGEALGNEAVRVAQEIRTRGEAPVWAASRSAAMPLRATKLPGEAREEAGAAASALEEARGRGAPEAETDRLRLDLIYARVRERNAVRRLACPNGELAAEIQGIAVGDAVLLGIPGELFTELGSELKEASPFEHTLVVGYANHHAGYIPTADALGSGGYEVDSSRFGASAVERLMGTAKGLAKDLHAVKLLDVAQ